MRLTPDLINSSLSYLNPIKERELDLRGHKIPTIENLGVAKDQDAIDLTDNDIQILSNFPLSPRLHSLYCARNRIVSIERTLSRSIPHLTTLALAQNQIAELADLDPLAGFTKLTHLSLIDNPVATKEYYRYWVIFRCRSVHFLDFQRVKDAERKKAKELFGTMNEPTDLANQISSVRSKNPGAGAASSMTANGTGKGHRIQLSEKQRKKFQQLVHDAKSLKEIERLETELNEGRIPAAVLADEDEEMQGI